MRLTGLWWWIDRWRKSTAFMDMTLEQQGAYRNLLDEAALRGGPLPNDERVLAKACGDSSRWRRVRAVVMARFRLEADGWRNETLDSVLAESHRRSQKQRDYRNRTGNAGGNAENNGGGNKAGNNLRPPDPDPDPDPIKEQRKTKSSNGRSRRPIFAGQRFVVFDWMLEDLMRTLGPNTDDFDLHTWFFELDAATAKTGLVLPKQEQWPWLQAELLKEAKRRELPIADTRHTQHERAFR